VVRVRGLVRGVKGLLEDEPFRVALLVRVLGLDSGCGVASGGSLY